MSTATIILGIAGLLLLAQLTYELFFIRKYVAPTYDSTPFETVEVTLTLEDFLAPKYKAKSTYLGGEIPEEYGYGFNLYLNEDIPNIRLWVSAETAGKISKAAIKTAGPHCSIAFCICKSFLLKNNGGIAFNPGREALFVVWTSFTDGELVDHKKMINDLVLEEVNND